MKKITTLIILLLCATALFAQAPEKFSYQAVVRNASNSLVTDAQVGVRVNILQGTASGNAVYSESHIVNTNANGLVTVSIGGGSVLHGSFESIDWSDGPYFLKTDIDPNGGNDYSITSVQQLLSVPYALYAKEASNSFSGDYNDLTNTPQIPQIPADVSAFNNDAGYITIDSVPAIPTNVSAFTNDAGYITSYTETDPQFNAWDKDYNDLINTPTIPTTTNQLTNNSGFITAADIPAQINADWNATSGAAEILNKPIIPTVPADVSAFNNDAGYLTNYTETDPQFNAWDKDYNDLINTPTIPAAANDATLTIQKNGNSIGTFTANASDNQTINVTVPTTTSELTNNSGFVTESNLSDIITTLNGRIDSLNNAIAAMGGDIPLIPVAGQITLTTNEVTDITVTTATAGGNITNSGGFAITDRGVCWSLNPYPTLSDNYVAASTGGTGNFTVNLTGLSIGNTYYVRAYATNTFGTTYGNQVVFCTPTIPSVTTADLTALSGSSAAGGGEVTGSGGATVTARGVCWSTLQNPTTSDNHTSNGTGVGSFTSTLTGLSPNVTYYVRAYATNMAGTAYGTQKTVIVAASELPVVETTSVTDVVISTATFSGIVTSDGGYALSAKGFCWGTSPNPTTDNSNTTNGIDLGSFTANIAGLTGGTTYYVRAYATNLAGTAYGAQLTFTTDSQGQACPGTPTVTDVDGNTYHTIKIGDQCWMKENLRTTKFPNGTSIALGNDTSSVTAYRYYPNNNSSNVSTYGYLYNWKAVMNGQGSSTANPSGRQGICPTGWHVPSHAEWQQLESFVNNQYSSNTSTLNTYAKVLAATSEWGTDASLNSTAPGHDQSTNNATGFSAYPAGRFYVSYSNFSSRASFWSASSTGNTYYYEFDITKNSTIAYNQGGGFTSQYALSIRCVKNDDSYTPEQQMDAQPCPYMHTMKDYDGNVYNTVQIGTQCWMKENLKTTHFYNGTAIALGSLTSTSVAYRYNPNNDSNRVAAYGYLYNWTAVMNGGSSSNNVPSGRQGICPLGWHVPSDAEWTILTDYVSGVSAYKCNSDANSIAKALASTTGWSISTGTCHVGNNQSINNVTGFGALPAGLWGGGGEAYFGSEALFWSATEVSTVNTYAWYRGLSYDSYQISRNTSNSDGTANVKYKARGYSIRCLRD